MTTRKIETKDDKGNVIRTAFIDDISIACRELHKYLIENFQLKDFIVAQHPKGIILHDTAKESRINYLDEIVPEHWDGYFILINYSGPLQ